MLKRQVEIYTQMGEMKCYLRNMFTTHNMYNIFMMTCAYEIEIEKPLLSLYLHTTEIWNLGKCDPHKKLTDFKKCFG